jgi:multiple sugar transport system permease protein
MPIIGLLAVLRTIWTFNEFDDIFLLTGGAAGTNVASVQIYNSSPYSATSVRQRRNR